MRWPVSGAAYAATAAVAWVIYGLSARPQAVARAAHLATTAQPAPKSSSRGVVAVEAGSHGRSSTTRGRSGRPLLRGLYTTETGEDEEKLREGRKEEEEETLSD